MISFYLPSGSKIGSGYQAHYMANALARRGHRVTMFSPCGPSEGAAYDTATVDVGRSLRTFRFAWNLRRVDFAPFDVVHAHGDDYWLWGAGGGAAVDGVRGRAAGGGRRGAGHAVAGGTGRAVPPGVGLLPAEQLRGVRRAVRRGDGVRDAGGGDAERGGAGGARRRQVRRD